MESTLFPSKPSFAFLAWLVILVAIATSPAVLDTCYHLAKTAYSNVNNTVLINTASAHTFSVEYEPITYSKKSANFVPTLSKKDTRCMAENIYYEAATQSYVGKMAVGLVVLNRLKAPNYPDSVCGVIYEGSQNVHTSTCQFSWTCNEHNPINTNSAAWKQSINVATELLTKQDSIIDITEGATSYHANYVNPPWAKQLKYVVQIDQHIFYSIK